MTIGCFCGATIYDQHDALPDKAHFIPDQAWADLWSKIESEFLSDVAAGKLDGSAAYRELYLMFHRARRFVHQCGACGRLYVDGPDGNLECYVPADAGTARQVLRRSRRDA